MVELRKLLEEFFCVADSPYRQPMSESILQLQEQGRLTRMKDKWWKEKRGGGACTVCISFFI